MNKYNSDSEKVFKYLWILWVMWALCGFSLFMGFIYVALHFIGKYW